MDIPFYYDPTSLAHADALRGALAVSLTADACRATKYGFNDDDDVRGWLRGKTPDDVRAAYEERLGAAMRELREATVETAWSMEEEDEDERDGGGGGGVRAYATVPGGQLRTPATSGDEEERGERKRERGGMEVQQQRLDTPRRKKARMRAARRRMAAAAGLTGPCNTHAMTTRSKVRKSRSSG